MLTSSLRDSIQCLKLWFARAENLEVAWLGHASLTEKQDVQPQSAAEVARSISYDHDCDILYYGNFLTTVVGYIDVVCGASGDGFVQCIQSFWPSGVWQIVLDKQHILTDVDTSHTGSTKIVGTRTFQL